MECRHWERRCEQALGLGSWQLEVGTLEQIGAAELLKRILTQGSNLHRQPTLQVVS